MSPRSTSWPVAGAVAGALCIALAAPPAFAHPEGDEKSSAKHKKVQKEVKKEVRVYTDEDGKTIRVIGDDMDGNVIRIYDDEGREIRVLKGIEVGDDNDVRVYRGGNKGEFQIYREGEEGELKGAYLGVRVQDVTRELQKARDLPNTEGALISRVEPDSPAAKAGVLRGDVIVELNREQVSNASELTRRVRDMEPGAKVPVTVLRDGMRKTLTATLGSRPRDLVVTVPRMPRGGRHWVERTDGDFEMPAIPELGEQLDRIRVYRNDVQRQLDMIQRDLSQLRDGDLQRLEEELRGLREELRTFNRERSGRPD